MWDCYVDFLKCLDGLSHAVYVGSATDINGLIGRLFAYFRGGHQVTHTMYVVDQNYTPNFRKIVDMSAFEGFPRVWSFALESFGMLCTNSFDTTWRIHDWNPECIALWVTTTRRDTGLRPTMDVIRLNRAMPFKQGIHPDKRFSSGVRKCSNSTIECPETEGQFYPMVQGHVFDCFARICIPQKFGRGRTQLRVDRLQLRNQNIDSKYCGWCHKEFPDIIAHRNRSSVVELGIIYARPVN